MSVNVVDGMLTFQGEKASGCSGLNTLIVEVPFTTKLLIGWVDCFFLFFPNRCGFFKRWLLAFWPKILFKV